MVKIERENWLILVIGLYFTGTQDVVLIAGQVPVPSMRMVAARCAG